MSPWRALILVAFAATAAAHAIKDDPEHPGAVKEPLKDQATLHNTKTMAKASQAKVEVTKPHPVKATVVAAKVKATPAKVAHTKAKLAKSKSAKAQLARTGTVAAKAQPANAKLTKAEKAKVEPTKSHAVAAEAKATPAEVVQTKAVPAMAKPAKSESAKGQPAKAAPLAAEKAKTAEPTVAKAEATAAEKEDTVADDDDIVRFTGKTAETGDWGEEYEGHMSATERSNFYAKYYSREAARGKHFRLPEQMPGVHSGAGRMAALLAPVALLLSF